MTDYVYAIFTRGTDYEDQEELYSLYRNQEDAELEASKLREEVEQEGYDKGDPLYAEVEVFKIKVQ
jgi:hypothetical protein